jgi:hypothetical protein
MIVRVQYTRLTPAGPSPQCTHYDVESMPEKWKIVQHLKSTGMKSDESSFVIEEIDERPADQQVYKIKF